MVIILMKYDFKEKNFIRKLLNLLNSDNSPDITMVVLTFRTAERPKTLLKYEFQYYTSLLSVPVNL